MAEQKSINETQEMQETLKKQKRRRKAAVNLLIRLLVLAAVVYALFFLIIGVNAMPNGDMAPRMDAGDLVLYYRLDKDVKAQDVIVFEKDVTEELMKGSAYASHRPASVKEGQQTFICRVVAVAGDTVEVTEEGSLVINGSTMIESNIFYSTYPYLNHTEYPLTLGEGECFVLADMRQGGADSRFFGPVNQDEIKGTVITILRRSNL